MSFEAYQNRINLSFSRSKASCIPGIVSNNANSEAKNVLRSMMSKGSSKINKISVIDPYFDEPDLVTIASFFGGLSTTNLEIISKFEAIKSTLSKEERKSSLDNKARFYISNSLFGKIVFHHSKIQMHDRYIIYWADKIVTSIVIIGGSFSQKFDDHILIYEVEDKYFETCVLKYYYKLLSDVI